MTSLIFEFDEDVSLTLIFPEDTPLLAVKTRVCNRLGKPDIESAVLKSADLGSLDDTKTIKDYGFRTGDTLYCLFVEASYQGGGAGRAQEERKSLKDQVGMSHHEKDIHSVLHPSDVFYKRVSVESHSIDKPHPTLNRINEDLTEGWVEGETEEAEMAKRDKTPKKVPKKVNFHIEQPSVGVDGQTDLDLLMKNLGKNSAGVQIEQFPFPDESLFSEEDGLKPLQSKMVDELMSMGFSFQTSLDSLKFNSWNKEEAINQILNNMAAIEDGADGLMESYMESGTNRFIGPNLPDESDSRVMASREVGEYPRRNHHNTESEHGRLALEDSRKERVPDSHSHPASKQPTPPVSTSQPKTLPNPPALCHQASNGCHSAFITKSSMELMSPLVQSLTFHHLKLRIEDDQRQVKELIELVENQFQDIFWLFVYNPEVLRLMLVERFPSQEMQLLEVTSLEDSENIQNVS